MIWVDCVQTNPCIHHNKWHFQIVRLLEITTSAHFNGAIWIHLQNPFRTVLALVKLRHLPGLRSENDKTIPAETWETKLLTGEFLGWRNTLQSNDVLFTINFIYILILTHTYIHIFTYSYWRLVLLTYWSCLQEGHSNHLPFQYLQTTAPVFQGTGCRICGKLLPWQPLVLKKVKHSAGLFVGQVPGFQGSFILYEYIIVKHKQYLVSIYIYDTYINYLLFILFATHRPRDSSWKAPYCCIFMNPQILHQAQCKQQNLPSTLLVKKPRKTRPRMEDTHCI